MLTAILIAGTALWGGCALVVIGTALLSRVMPPVNQMLFEPARDIETSRR